MVAVNCFNPYDQRIREDMALRDEYEQQQLQRANADLYEPSLNDYLQKRGHGCKYDGELCYDGLYSYGCKDKDKFTGIGICWRQCYSDTRSWCNLVKNHGNVKCKRNSDCLVSKAGGGFKGMGGSANYVCQKKGVLDRSNACWNNPSRFSTI